MKADVLSDVLRAVRLTGAVYFDFELSAPWVAEAPSGTARPPAWWRTQCLDRGWPATTGAIDFSIVISRMSGQDANPADCTPFAKTVPVATYAAGIKQRGIRTVVGSIVLSRTDAADRGECVLHKDTEDIIWGYSKGSTWAQIATLRDTFGWKFVSHSKSYAKLTTLILPGIATIKDLRAARGNRAAASRSTGTP